MCATAIYNGVKRFRYGGSVVPAMPSASGIRVFIHDEAQGDFSGLVCVVHFRKESYANVVLSSGTMFPEVSERMTVGVAQSVLDRVWPPS